MFKTIYMLLLFSSILVSQNFSTFNKYFIDATMRIDYYHIGNSTTENFTIDHIYKQGRWAGSRVHLLDEFNNGAYYIKVYDKATNELIYSKGFDSYFKEYQTSANAIAGIEKSYHETALIPYPKNNVIFTVEKRDSQNQLKEIYSYEIAPEDISIIREYAVDPSIIVNQAIFNGDPHEKVDIAIIAEGYTKKEYGKYMSDLIYFSELLLNKEPYKSVRKKFNIYGVYKASLQSGTDEPRANIYKATTLNSTFNSLGSERYLLTEDNKTLRDLASTVPYDAIYIMVNHHRYGGGGIYNWSCTFTTDNQFKDYLFLHEFGHSFAGLADEYYTSSTAYDNFYKPTLEPVEPNITALLDKKNVKWKNLLSKEIELPTPWEKSDFDKMDYAWQKRRAELNENTAKLKREKSKADLIVQAEKYYAQQDSLHSGKVDRYLESSKFAGKVGAFEGAGYMATGLYRPMIDCIMFSKGDKPFCKVCEQAILKVIEHYTE